jgi:ABC-type branched-subunit amino acid transport system permease subunit
VTDYLVYLVIGLGSGAIYAVLALGLVLQYRGTNVLNFAFAAMMMTSSLVYAGARVDGVLLLPIPGVPGLRLSNGPAAAWEACVAALLVSLALGLAAHLLVFRWLRDAPALSRVAAAVGVMLTLQAIAVLQYSNIQAGPPGVLPSSVLTIFGARVFEDRLLLAGIAALVAVAMWAFFAFTTAGLAIRASAENERGAAVVGWSQERHALQTWVGAAALAGAMGILVAPIAAQDPTVYTLLIIPGLAAALLARFRSFLLCVVAGLGIGMVQSLLTKAAHDFNWLPQVGLQDAVPFVVIIAVLAVGGAVLPLRGAVTALRHPVAYAPRNVTVRAIVLIAGSTLLVCFSHGAARYALVASMIGVLLALSIVVVTGYTGLISLAQYAFAGLAGFMVSKLAAGLGVPFPIAPLLAAISAAALGLLIGLPALRVRGINLAIVTLGVGSAVNSLLFQNPSFTGGYSGAPIPRPKLFGWDLGINAGHGEASLSFSLVCLAIAAVGCLAVSNLRRSGTGRRMLAVRANERAAAAAGVNVAQIKLLAFVISAFIAGIAGALLAYSQVGGILSFDQFGPIASIVLLAAVFIGGVSTVSGAILAGIAISGGYMYYLLAQNIADFTNWEALVGGVGLIMVAVRQPDGLAGYTIAGLRRLRRQHGEPLERAEAEPLPLPPVVQHAHSVNEER